jgi:AraC-like DNA-binding protein
LTLQASVSMGWVRTVVAAAARHSVPAPALLAAAGMPADALERDRWAVDDITRLWRAAERCTGDPGFGLKVGAGVTPASLANVSFALQSAATLREALGLVQRYQRLISDAGRFQMLPGETATWVVYHPCQGQLAFSPLQIEAVLAAVVTLAGWLSGTALPPATAPRRVQFSQAQLGPLAGYRQVFGCPVEFEQAFSGLLIDNTVLDQPLPHADRQLAQVHQRYTAAQLAALGSSGIRATDLVDWLAAFPGPHLPRRADAARALGVSVRTLARRLAEQGRSWESLLDDLRRERALAAVADPQRPLADIAQALGFAEASTFYRAFHRWTGMPPARWRRQVCSAHADR